MKTKHIKAIVTALFILPLFLITMMSTGIERVRANSQDDAAATYKKKTCFACHKPDASKHFDPNEDDAVLVNAILKGVKGEKPPYMPAYENKGIDADQAAALVAYMRSLREASK